MPSFQQGRADDVVEFLILFVMVSEGGRKIDISVGFPGFLRGDLDLMKVVVLFVFFA